MLNTVVIGAGHAGLAAGYFLARSGLSHVVFERGRIAESWRTQRWDSFYLNTPNSMSHLPGNDYAGEDPDAFYHRDEFVASLEQYASRFNLSVETGVTVERISPIAGRFRVTIRRGSHPAETIEAESVIVASGLQNVARLPAVATSMPASMAHLHAADYRSPEQLPPGAVLVVGSGQSGFQIAEDLLEAGREVYFSSSRVARVPRRYRGRDILYWLEAVGVFAQRTSDLDDRSIVYQAVPHVSGVGIRGRTVSYQQLARYGATVLGRLTRFRNGRFTFAGDAAENVRFADEKSDEMKKAIDNFLVSSGRELPPPEDDPMDMPDPEARCASVLTELDAADRNIASVVWCTGFKGAFEWIDAPILGDDGRPLHHDGVSNVPGLYFVGFPWLRNRKSGIITGAGEDAEFIVSRIAHASVAQ
ncbi:MAG TPA: NAD(P)/FAD-dependent oxidoreductase [Rhodothermales bacterium]|nr:NAD(P)/FAD-dependent oxidoreductase [Rhodothermales bacterium]